jgi:hypothetical protein
MRHGLDINLATGSGSPQPGLSTCPRVIPFQKVARPSNPATVLEEQSTSMKYRQLWTRGANKGVVPFSTGNRWSWSCLRDTNNIDQGLYVRHRHPYLSLYSDSRFICPLFSDQSDLTVIKHALRTHTDAWPRHRRWTDQLSPTNNTAPRFLSCLS